MSVFAEEMKSIRCLVGFLVVFLQLGCGDCPQSYESQFKDTVLINYPPGHPFDEVGPLRVRVDDLLRSRKIGFWSGVMGEGMMIDHISLGLDFDLANEAKLVQSLIDEGMIPKNVEIEYHPKKTESDND